MADEIGFIHVAPIDASAVVPPEGHLLYAKDTDKIYKSDGTTKTELGAGGGSFTTEDAQDAVGTILANTSTINLSYADATPAITADVNNDSITYAKIQNVTDNRLLGRSAGSTGDVQEITAGPGLALTSGVLSSNRIYGLLDVKPTVDTPDDEFDTGSLDGKWTVVSGSSGSVSLMSSGTTLQTYDLTTRVGWLLVQVGKNTGQLVSLRQDYGIPDGSSIVLAVSHTPGVSNGTALGNSVQMDFGLNNNNASIGSGDFVQFLIDAESSTFSRTFVTSSVAGDITGQGMVLSGTLYMRICRVGLVYHCFATSGQSGNWMFVGSKTLPNAADNIWIQFRTAATVTGPAPINGIDWIRQGTNDMDPW